MYSFVCNHCESTAYPHTQLVSYLNSEGTELDELRVYCTDCGEFLDGEQETEFFADLDRSAL